MNHLCGIPSLGGGAHLPKVLSEDELNALKTFRARYETEALGELINSKVNIIDNDAEEKEDSSLQHNMDSNKETHTPTYEVSYDLPASGIRSLDDITLYRFMLADKCKTNEFDLEASHTRLINALKFRKEYKSDMIVHNLATNNIPDKVEECRRLRVACWAGTDHECRPVVFERLGEFFSSGNTIKVEIDDWITSYLYFLETHFMKMRQSAEKNGKIVDRIVYFADFQGVVTSIMNRKIWQVIPLLQTLVKTVELHYPEIVDHIILFNAPRIASAAYKVVKGFLDPVTAAKIQLFSGVPLERFTELVPVSVIPQEYGGTNTTLDYPKTALK